MMHARIFEEPGTAHEKENETLAHCLEQVKPSDRDYYRRREIQEAEAARMAACREARLAHEEMAAVYGVLSSSDETRIGSHLSAELAEFLFNPKPVT